MDNDGRYAKGRAKREELLKVALEVFSNGTYSSSSVTDIAAAANISRPTLLYYFGSREMLFAEVVRWRDDINRQVLSLDDGLIEGFLRLAAYNQAVPGVIQVFSTISAEATDAQHPANGYFKTRYEELMVTLTAEFESRQKAGKITDKVSASSLARMYVAMSDGLQLQWLHEKEIRLADHLGDFLRLLEPEPRSEDDGTKSGM